MHDNKAFRILTTLSPVEFRQLKQFIRSGYTTKDKYILRVLEVIEQQYPVFEKEPTDRLRLFSIIYPGEPFNMPKLRRLFSDLTLLIEDYLVQVKLENDKTGKQALLKKVYYERGQENYYEHLLVLEHKQIEEQRIRDAAYYYRLFTLRDEQYQFLSGKQNRSKELQPQALLESLEVFYLASKLRICCELVNRGNILNTGTDQSMVAGMLEISNQDIYKNVPVIVIYRSILLTLTQPEQPVHYRHLKDSLKEVHDVFSTSELRDIYSLAQNYCIRKINTGVSEYLKELFELYRLLLDSKLLIEEGYLSQWHYKNIVYTALRLNEFNWCKKFIEDMAVHLEPSAKENAYTYNLAYYHFFAKEYQKTLGLLNKIEFTDIFYFLDSRSLLLKTFFELDEIDPLLSLLDTFQSNLKRNKLISGYQKTVYLNLVRVVRKLVKLEPGNKEQIQKLLDYTERNREIADRTWVQSKLRQLAI